MYTCACIQWSNLFRIYFYSEDCCYANTHRPTLCLKDIWYMENQGWQEGGGNRKKESGLQRHTANLPSLGS